MKFGQISSAKQAQILLPGKVVKKIKSKNMFANMENYWGHWGFPFAVLGFTIGGFLLLILLTWSIYWKGRGLWKAAKNDSKKWFVALLVINTLGILEILYIYVFSKKKYGSQNDKIDKHSKIDNIGTLIGLIFGIIVCIVILAVIMWAFKIVF